MSKLKDLVIEEENQIRDAEECDLEYVGYEDGRPCFIGTDKAWKKFNN